MWEFMSDPATGLPLLDIELSGPQTAQIVLYAMTNRTDTVESAAGLEVIPADWQPWSGEAIMTNSFRIFPDVPANEAKRFFRAREL